MRKSAKAPEQLREFFQQQSKLKLAPPLLALIGEGASQSLSLDDPDVWTSCARHALTLDDKTDGPLKQVFRQFGLDPNNPLDWRQLVTWIALFLKLKKKSGRPTGWTIERYCELLQAVDRRKHGNPSLSDSQACTLIAKDKVSPTYFRKAKPQGLRKALGRARSAEYNDVSTIIVAANAQLLRRLNLRREITG
jgi:hypothetical protein